MNLPSRHLLAGTFLGISLLLLLAFNLNRPRILVLHSASNESRWVKDVNVGIRRTLATQLLPVTVEWDYMDEDKRTDTALQTAEAHRAIARLDPDILIAVDDEANAQVARHYVNRERPRIVFVSIDQSPAFYGYDGLPNITGIAERLPLAAVRDVLPILPGNTAQRIAAIAVNNPTGQAELSQVRGFNWSPHRLVASKAVATFTDWQTFVNNRKMDADILLVLSYSGLKLSDSDNSGFADGNLIASWVESQAAPIPIGLHVAYVADGGGLAFAPPPTVFGEQAMAMALTWVENKASPQTTPPTWSEHFDVAVRAGPLNHRGIKLLPIYIEAARLGRRYYP